jgi:cell division protein FtsB
VFEKIKSYQNHPYLQQFRDIRAVGLAVFAIIALMVTWSGIKAVQTNYGLQKQISSLQQQNQVSTLQNNNLKLQNEYLKTDQFLELSARREFGLAAPGEKVILVPETVALKYAKDVASSPKKVSSNEQEEGNRSIYQQNFEHWVDFFMHRPASN